jgi:hypothetical protein
MPSRNVLTLSAVALAAAAVGQAPALAVAGQVPARTAAARHCGNVRTNRFYHPAAHGQFGAYGIAAQGASCATARKVAGKFVRNAYSVGNKPTVSHINGFACRWKAGSAVQQVEVTCTRSSAKVTFADRLPSG